MYTPLTRLPSLPPPLPPCPCFTQDGLKRCVNAVDLVYAVTALLECGSRKGPASNFGDHVDKFWCVCGMRGRARSWLEQNGPCAAQGRCRTAPVIVAPSHPTHARHSPGMMQACLPRA